MPCQDSRQGMGGALGPVVCFLPKMGSPVLLFPLVVLCVPDSRGVASILLLAGLVILALLTWDLLAFYVAFESCAVPLLLTISRES